MKKYILFCLLVISILIIYRQKNKKKIPKPIINRIDNFLSPDECINVIKLCKNFFKSGTTDGKTNNLNVGRTSETTVFKNGENGLIDIIINRISSKLHIDKEYMETIQITKYSKGQEYKFHHDYFPKHENQRKYTILIYLNTLDKEDGGATTFLYGDTIQPKQGTLLQWLNVNNHGVKQKNTLHAGKPILTDNNKYIITLWTRQKPFKKN